LARSVVAADPSDPCEAASACHVITLYTWTTPNGYKASIMLEEIGATYSVKPVNLAKGEQHASEFVNVSPNNKIPAIVDDSEASPRAVFETGAILIYLAEKSGQLLPARGALRDQTLEWLFWASTGLAPMLGQWNFFARRATEKTPVAIEHFTREAIRLLHVLEGRLAEAPYLAQQYSIADVAAFTWTRAILPELKKDAADGLAGVPSIDRWLGEIGARQAVARGLEVPKK
jgi:GSH-dependent disulfide-bond oxidoreductase